jgi:predicted ArsR family transcriptional regulator
MFEDMRSVCRVDLSVLGAILKANVRQTNCRHDGAPCCTFEVAAQNGKGP